MMFTPSAVYKSQQSSYFARKKYKTHARRVVRLVFRMDYTYRRVCMRNTIFCVLTEGFAGQANGQRRFHHHSHYASFSKRLANTHTHDVHTYIRVTVRSIRFLLTRVPRPPLFNQGLKRQQISRDGATMIPVHSIDILVRTLFLGTINCDRVADNVLVIVSKTYCST